MQSFENPNSFNDLYKHLDKIIDQILDMPRHKMFAKNYQKGSEKREQLKQRLIEFYRENGLLPDKDTMFHLISSGNGMGKSHASGKEDQAPPYSTRRNSRRLPHRLSPRFKNRNISQSYNPNEEP